MAKSDEQSDYDAMKRKADEQIKFAVEHTWPESGTRFNAEISCSHKIVGVRFEGYAPGGGLRLSMILDAVSAELYCEGRR